ncbi:MAG: hypothetical protein WBS24_12495 [Terriglobales bacterium]
MNRILLLAMFIFLSIVSYAADVPLQCDPAASSSQSASSPAPSSPSAASTSQTNEEVIFFVVTASTNTPAVCYAVRHSGTVIKQMGATRLQMRSGQTAPAVQQGSIPASVSEKIFSDVEAAMPLSALPKEFCAKSVSFGTSQYVFFKGEKSPDLCGHGNDKKQALKGDFSNIMSDAKFEPAKP